MNLKRLLAATAMAGALILSTVLPASAGSASGYRACGSGYTASVSSGSYSSSYHTHSYRSDSGDTTSRRSSSAVTSFGSQGPWRNANWTVSNGTSEALRSASASCLRQPL